MGERREWRAFAVVMVLMATVSATAFVSCGGGGKAADSDGGLCEECGDTDGPCIGPATLSNDELTGQCPLPPQPTGVGSTPVPRPPSCSVALRCARKADSGQRRCFPVNPNTLQLEFSYECDGSRPEQTFVQTPGPPATATLTALKTATPAPSVSSSGNVTPAPSVSTAGGVTPEPSVTPEPEEVDVDITVETAPPDGDYTGAFTVTVVYPQSKGGFGSAPDCSGDTEGLTPTDDGNGNLTLSFAPDPDRIFEVVVTCTFLQFDGQTLQASELRPAVVPDDVLTVKPPEI